jgi:hypothetical protein
MTMRRENGYHYIVDQAGEVQAWREDISAWPIINSITGQCINPEAKNDPAGHRRRLREGFPAA